MSPMCNLERLRSLLLRATLLTCLSLVVAAPQAFADDDDDDAAPLMTPTGQHLTPTAAPRSDLQALDPDLPNYPDFRAGYAVTARVSPDRRTLLVLTSGFNGLGDAQGNPIAETINEYVFVYDVSRGKPVKKQVVQVPNSFLGLTFSPDGKAFYVSGGGSDVVFTFEQDDKGRWVADGAPIPLGHASGLGLFDNPPTSTEAKTAAGIAVTADGKTLVVANLYNDSISLIDLKQRKVTAELDLRPGKLDAAKKGVPGGEYPWWVVVKGNRWAFVSSVRDREVVVVDLKSLTVAKRIKVPGNPNKMILDRAGARLFVAQENSDLVSVIDTKTYEVLEGIRTIAPAGYLPGKKGLTGAGPNDVALSPDERRLFVTNGQANSVSVIELGGGQKKSRVIGLLPTAWSPNASAFGADGRTLYVINGKSPAGPNPKLNVPGGNQYILQLEKASLLSFPVPSGADLEQLTRQVAANNGWTAPENEYDEDVMAGLRKHIKHVIYVLKENRTYDQVLGDLPKGNGDPSLTMFGRKITPNQHKIAEQFVTLDNLYCSGEVSGDGWPWSTASRESDLGIKTLPGNYGGRGTGNYEFEGYNRNVNVGVGTVAERKALNPIYPDDPDLLPGTANVVEPDGPIGSPKGKGYIWDAVLRAGLTFRAYGPMSEAPGNGVVAPRYPSETNTRVAWYNNPELLKYGNPYVKGYDNCYPDTYRILEWEKEFEQHEKNGSLPNFSFIALPSDHMGCFDSAIDGVNTPETQQGVNDHALGYLIQKVAHSKYKDSTLIFSIEDDAQDGPDHVDAHRTIGFVAGPYVKQGAVVSTFYSTVNMIRTIEDVLGLEHLNLNTASARPMTEVFDLKQKAWTYKAKIPAALLTTQLPLERVKAEGEPLDPSIQLASTHDGAWWAEATEHLDFSELDGVNSDAFNRVLWAGIMGENVPYPTERSGTDLSQNREELLKNHAD